MECNHVNCICWNIKYKNSCGVMNDVKNCPDRKDFEKKLKSNQKPIAKKEE